MCHVGLFCVWHRALLRIIMCGMGLFCASYGAFLLIV